MNEKFNKIPGIVVLIVFFIFGCDQKQTNIRLSEIDNISENGRDLKVILDKDDSILVSFKTISSSKEEAQQDIISYDYKDTIAININKASFLLIGSKYTLYDTLLVFPGDTLKLKVNHRKILSTSHSNFKWPELRNPDIQKIKNKEDSMSKYFYEYDHARKMRFHNETSSIEIMPVNYKYESLSIYKKSFIDLINLKIEKYLFQEKAYKQLVENNKLSYDEYKLFDEMLKYILFKELTMLHAFSNSDYVLDRLKSDLFMNDSLLISPFAHAYLLTYINKVILLDKASTSKSKLYINYKEAFDILPVFFEGEILRYAYQVCLENMMEVGEDFSAVENYFNKYKQLYNDTIFNRRFESNYLMNFAGLKKIKTDLSLIDEKGMTFTLTDLLAQNQGKVLYIDFWASWCAPCRQVMPDSKKLKLAYKGKDVSIVYLSIDKNRDHWLKASSIEKLSFDNYLILNHQNADFIKNLKVNAIPRYLLYDKQGKLVHQDAPGPKGREIRKLLDKYLAQ